MPPKSPPRPKACRAPLNKDTDAAMTVGVVNVKVVVVLDDDVDEWSMGMNGAVFVFVVISS